jgi:hypothetical protein
VVTSGKNVAFLNGGDVNQNSGNWVDASNQNTATQSNTQSNSLGQRQTVDRGSCCENRCEPNCKPECDNSCEPKCDDSRDHRCEPKSCEERS